MQDETITDPPTKEDWRINQWLDRLIPEYALQVDVYSELP
jgi:hypothetical protein